MFLNSSEIRFVSLRLGLQRHPWEGPISPAKQTSQQTLLIGSYMPFPDIALLFDDLVGAGKQ
jgi:hypothetical protein